MLLKLQNVFLQSVSIFVAYFIAFIYGKEMGLNEQRVQEDTFELHSVVLEPEAIKKQIHDLQVMQAQPQEWKAMLD